MKPTLVILAAGMGSRYGGLKQLDPMGPNGETVLDYSVFDAIRAGFAKVVFIIRKDFEELFREQVGSRFDDKIQVKYAFQELDNLPSGYSVPEGRGKPWGTAHAVLCAENVINEPFVVINADDFYGRDAFQKISDHLSVDHTSSEHSQYSMVGFLLKNTLTDHGTVSRGVCSVDEDGYLITVDELTKIGKTLVGISNLEPGSECDLTGDEHVSMNFWGFTPEIFPQIRALFIDFLKKSGNEMKSEFYIPATVDELIKSKQAVTRVLETNGSWFGVTYKEDKPIVIESIRDLVFSGEYPNDLWH